LWYTAAARETWLHSGASRCMAMHCGCGPSWSEDAGARRGKLERWRLCKCYMGRTIASTRVAGGRRMALRGGYRRGVPAVAVTHLGRIMVLVVALCLLAAPTVVAAPLQPRIRRDDARPTPAVAYARIALVRVLTYYDGKVGTGALPTPAPSPCASDGVFVGTTGSDLNSFNYVLTPTAAINPTTPCQGAQVAFQQLYGRADSWDISHIDVLLNVAYTGTGDKQVGAVKFCIDPAQNATLGEPTTPAL